MFKLRERDDEEILEPDLLIVDSSHHLYDRQSLRYMIQDYVANANAGHKVVASVYIETREMTRADGPERLRPVGEVEFANGVAAMAASGRYGSCKVAAAIVGYADLTAGACVAETLDGSMRAAPDRYRGVRQIAIDHPDASVLRNLTNRPRPDLLSSGGFSAGLAELAKRDLMFVATVLHWQLPLVAKLADEHPNLVIALEHTGLAVAMNAQSSDRRAVFDDWREKLRELARRPNVVCKIGGLGTVYWGFGFDGRTDPIGYAELATAWRPWVECAVEAFGPSRSMMESNFPSDARSCGFVPLWNALKHITSGCSVADKNALYHGTAARIHRIALPTL